MQHDSAPQPETQALLATTTITPTINTIVSTPLKAVIENPDSAPSKSIYELHSHRQAALFLSVAAVGCLQMPLGDTIYFPSISVIAPDFNTSTGIVALTVAVYMFSVGLASLFWGPAADRYGRKKILLIASILYTTSNIVCYFAPNVIVLIVFRAVQGASVSAFILGSVVVMDIYPLNKRGSALGLFNIPMFVGPLAGPVVGGALAQQWGWRSTFLLLIALATLVFLAILFFLPETHHWYVLRRYKKSGEETLIVEAESIEATPPIFLSPLKALCIAFKPNILPYFAVSCIEFAAFYGALTLFSPLMALPPYKYDQFTIGLLYIPMGVGAMLASVYGGRITDWSGERYPKVPEGRMFACLLITVVVFPVGILLYGWSLQYRIHIAPILASMFLMGFGCNVYFPAVLAYVGGINQAEAAAASSVFFCTVLVSAGVGSEVVGYIADAIDLGPMMCVFAGMWVVPTVISLSLILHKQRRAGHSLLKEEQHE